MQVVDLGSLLRSCLSNYVSQSLLLIILCKLLWCRLGLSRLEFGWCRFLVGVVFCFSSINLKVGFLNYRDRPIGFGLLGKRRPLSLSILRAWSDSEQQAMAHIHMGGRA